MLEDFRVPVSKLVEVVLHVGKGAKFGLEKVNSAKIYAETPVLEVERILKNKLTPLRFKKKKIIYAKWLNDKSSIKQGIQRKYIPMIALSQHDHRVPLFYGHSGVIIR